MHYLTRKTRSLKSRYRVVVGVFALLLGTAANAQEAEEVRLPGTEISFSMVTLPGGVFEVMEAEIKLSPFAISTHEVTHDAYRIFQRRENDSDDSRLPDYDADAVTRPSPPYLDFTYGMGTRGGYPEVNVTQQAALRYCEWLYEKTGRFFRLPTEAEWEYACLAGSDTGPEPSEENAWVYENSEEVFHKTGLKAPNAWGLYDMLGNVSEWTADDWADDYPTEIGDDTSDPWIVPDRKHSRAVRGGHFDMDRAEVGCRVREKSQVRWQARDPQIPKSKWWNVDSAFLGFRIVSPAAQPTEEEIRAYFIQAIVD